MASRTPLSQINPNGPRMSLAGTMSGPKRVSNAHKKVERKSMGTALVRDRRQSSIGGGMAKPTNARSSISSRRSSTYGGTQRDVDPRPVADNEWKEQTIQMIIRYLSEEGYPNAISPKMLRQPNNKDFFLIVAFLYRQIDSSFRMSAKAEEDVAMIFKHLRYPHAINKSYLKSVGSPYTWPTLLAALGWFVQTLIYQREVDMRRETEDGDTTLHGYDDSKLFFRYLSGAYATFLAGEDDFNHWDQQLQHSFDSRNGTIKSDIEKMEDRNAELRRAIAELENAKDPIPELEKNKGLLEADVRKFDVYIEQLESYNEKMRTKMQELNDEIADIERMQAEVEEETEAIAKILEEQEQNCVDIDELTSEKADLNHKLEVQGQRLLVAKKELDRTEMNLERFTKSLEEKLETYQSTGRQLKLLPITAKNANGIDFNLSELMLDSKCGSADMLHRVVSHLKDTVEPALHKLREKYAHKFKDYQVEQMKLQRSLDLKEEEIQEERYVLESLRTKLSKVSRAVDLENEALENNRKQTTSETEALQSGMQNAMHEIQLDYEQSIKRVEELQATLDTQRQCFAKESAALDDGLINALDQLFAHKTYIQETLQKIHELMEQQKQELL